MFLAETNADGLTASVVVDVESLPMAAALTPPYAAPPRAADRSAPPPACIEAAEFCRSWDQRGMWVPVLDLLRSEGIALPIAVAPQPPLKRQHGVGDSHRRTRGRGCSKVATANDFGASTGMVRT